VREGSLESRSASTGEQERPASLIPWQIVFLRYECTECSHSFCGAHARDSWLSEEEEEDSEEPEAPATRGRSSSLEKPPDLDPFLYD